MAEWRVRVCPGCKHSQFTMRDDARAGVRQVRCAACGAVQAVLEIPATPNRPSRVAPM
jgi:hypothetical protein